MYRIETLRKYRDDKNNPEYIEAMEFLEKRYEKYTDIHKEFNYLMLVDRTGEIVFASTPGEQCCVGKHLDELAPDEKDLFEKAKKGIYRTDILHHLDHEEYSMILTGPLTMNEDFIGVAVIGINIGSISDVMSEMTGLGETGETYLVGKDFLLRSQTRFAGPEAVLKMKVDTEATRQWYHAHIAEDVQKHTYVDEHPQVPKHSHITEKLDIYTDYRGVEVMGTHYHIPETGWVMLAEIDTAEAFAALAWLRNYLMLIIGIVPVLAVLLGLLLSRGITGPITKLYEGAGIVGKGNLDYRIDVRSKDEIGELAGSFNKMTGDLKRSRQEIEFYSRGLERKVEERTKALQVANEGLKKSNAELALTAEKIRRANQEAQNAKKALEEKITELERFNKIAVGRELRMAELKQRIEELEKKSRR